MVKANTAPSVDKDQLPMPVYLPCACGCRQSVLQPTARSGGRPQRYFNAACRQAARRKRKWEAVWEQQRVEAQARQTAAAAELESALESVRADYELAEWLDAFKEVFHRTVTPAEALDLANHFARPHRGDPKFRAQVRPELFVVAKPAGYDPYTIRPSASYGAGDELDEDPDADVDEDS